MYLHMRIQNVADVYFVEQTHSLIIGVIWLRPLQTSLRDLAYKRKEGMTEKLNSIFLGNFV